MRPEDIQDPQGGGTNDPTPSRFIELTDYKNSIHDEIMDALTREDDSIILVCEDRAICEMRSYMSGRYDCEQIFSARGDERNPLILMMAIDITIFHVFCVHNPMKLSQMRKDRYDRAIEWLVAVSKGNTNIDGAPLLQVEDARAHDNHIMASNPKKHHHF